ncbi:MAG: hypothetical protein II355_03780 [Bacteroidales bacterium]|nr:hypothetical protein [Bacteroidales bacterium]
MKYIVYQALARLWGKGKLSSWDAKTLKYINSMGVDFLWLTGIPRHSTGKSFVKGDPGSPYSISDWFDINPYLADNPDQVFDEFDKLVKRVHKYGLKLIIDYIPNHVSPDYQGKIVRHNYCDGDWTDTLKNDWSNPQTLEAMKEILSFWAAKGVDGFRCDMVELVPADQLGELIKTTKASYPDLIFIAEAYSKDNYRHYIEKVGFDYLYDKSGLYDSLVSICKHGSTARSLTWNWQWLSDMQPKMLNFLENHDEQRAASSEIFGSAASSFAALGRSLLFNEAAFMIYFGQEAGESAPESDNARTSIFNWSKPEGLSALYQYVCKGKELPEERAQIFKRYQELLGLAQLPVFKEGKTWDLCYCNQNMPGFDADKHFAFLRYDDQSCYFVLCNFSRFPASVRLWIPEELHNITGCPTIDADAPSRDVTVIKLR